MIPLYRYCTSFVQVFKKAEARDEDGDEENAYLLFMRILYIFEKIKKSYEYQKKKVKLLKLLLLFVLKTAPFLIYV